MIIEGVVHWHRPYSSSGPLVSSPAEALRRVASDLDELASSSSAIGAEMLRAQAMMARDPALEPLLLLPEDQIIASLGVSHPDLHDVVRRGLAYRRGCVPGVSQPSHPHILVAEYLSAADLVQLDRASLVGIVTVEGGPTSHAAILARSFGIPFLSGYGEAGSFEDGQRIRVEVETGSVARGRVPLLANVSTLEEALAAAPVADGIGLLRTEFLYPSFDYAPLIAPFARKPVIIRVLDLGDRDQNPLGVRGLRYLQAHPALLDAQLAAIASLARPVSVMAPMVSTVEDARWFVSRARAFGFTDVGVMIEVPSAALCADEILAVVDFASIGTNDLAQFTLAASREEAALSSYQDASHPAVVHLIRLAIAAAQRYGKPIGACGEATADPAFANLLIDLGITTLSLPVGRGLI